MPSDEQFEQIAQDPDVQKLVKEARNLAGLMESDEWLHLRKKFERYQELVADRMAKQLLQGELPDQRKLDFSLGYAAAISDLLSAPERVEEELERAAESAYKRLQREQPTNPGGSA